MRLIILDSFIPFFRGFDRLVIGNYPRSDKKLPIPLEPKDKADNDNESKL